MRKYLTIAAIVIFTLGLVSPIVLAHETGVTKETEGNSMKESEMYMNEDGSAKEVKTFDLFWPVAAGKVPGESMYFLKSFKEKIRELFIFSKYQKVDYNIVLVEKRFAEAEKLLIEKKDVNNATAALKMAQNERQAIVKLLDELKKDSTDISSLLDRFHSSLHKQRALLSFWKTKSLDGTESLISTELESISSTESQLGS